MITMMTTMTMTGVNHHLFSFIPSLLCSISVIFFCSGCTPIATQQEVPELISSRFNAMYPGAKQVNWTNQSGAYEVAFIFKQTEFKVLFLADGAVERTKTKSKRSALPEGVTTYAANQLSNAAIGEILRVVDGFGVVTWEVEIGDKRYLFTTQGELIGQL